MSYLSIESVINERGLNNETATEEQREDALWEAFHRDLPLGVAWVRKLANQFVWAGQRVVINEDPKSPTGQQVIRLLGSDVARRVCRRKLMEEFELPSLALGLFNCCGGVAGVDEADLNMTAKEQIDAQTKKENAEYGPSEHC